MAYTADLIPTMTANDAPSGVCSSLSYLGVDYAPWKAFDKNNDTIFHSNGGYLPGGWLQYQFASAKTITQYTLTISTNSLNAWSLYGSNDGSTWGSALDTRSGITFTGGVKQTFQFTNSTAYAYYRIVGASGGYSNYLVVQEWEMMETEIEPTTNYLSDYRGRGRG